jgi:hypothetical protein
VQLRSSDVTVLPCRSLTCPDISDGPASGPTMYEDRRLHSPPEGN